MSSSRFKNVSKFLSKVWEAAFKMVSLYFSLSLRRLSSVLGTYQKSGVTWAYFEECLLYPEKVQCRVYIAFYLGRLDLISCLLVYVVREFFGGHVTHNKQNIFYKNIMVNFFWIWTSSLKYPLLSWALHKGSHMPLKSFSKFQALDWNPFLCGGPHPFQGYLSMSN